MCQHALRDRLFENLNFVSYQLFMGLLSRNRQKYID